MGSGIFNRIYRESTPKTKNLTYHLDKDDASINLKGL